MSDDIWMRVEQLQRRLTALENLNVARAPIAIAGQNFASTQVLTGVAFNLGDVLKCVANVWSLCTSADEGALVVGVVTQASGTSCTVTMMGERSDANAGGLPGTVYWVADIGGESTNVPSTTGMQRVIELQISPTIRLVVPDPLAWFAVTVKTCDAGTPTDHDMAYYLKIT